MEQGRIGGLEEIGRRFRPAPHNVRQIYVAAQVSAPEARHIYSLGRSPRNSKRKKPSPVGAGQVRELPCVAWLSDAVVARFQRLIDSFLPNPGASPRLYIFRPSRATP